MKVRTLATLGLLALLALALFRLLASDGAEDRRPDLADRPAATETPAPAPQEDLEPPADPVAPVEGEAAEVAALEVPEPVEPRRDLARDPGERQDWPEEATRWVEVSLVAPAGVPADERAWVVALSEKTSDRGLRDTNGPLTLLHEGTPASEIEVVLAAVSLEPGGSARLALPPEPEACWLAVGGSYLYSREPVAIDFTAAEPTVELHPILGARISGRLVPPEGASDVELSGVEVDLDWSTSTALQLGAASSTPLNVEAETDEKGAFELRAVPVGKPQTLQATSPDLATVFSEDLQPAPGEHLEIALAVQLGATLRGRVVDEEGRAVAGAEVHGLGREFLGNPSARMREGESDEAGFFELSNVAAGRTWIRVRHDHYQELMSPPFDLMEGETHDHGDLVLVEGLGISGTVVFPDGTPATDTTVRIEPDLSENLAGSSVDPSLYAGRNNHGEVDAEGKFEIHGLGEGPWVVTAELEVGERTEDLAAWGVTAEGGAGRAAGRWTASRDVVRAPSHDLSFVLEEPVNVAGTVVDGAGEPLAQFTIRAERKGSQWYMPPSEVREKAFESEDGSFRMSDLRAGSWSFTAEAEGFARSAELTMELPSEEPASLVLLRFVRLAGRVVDPDGMPVAEAEVGKELEGTEVFEAMQGRGRWPKAQTDAEGHFELEGLAPGAGSILAKKDGFAPSEAVSFELAEGEERTDFLLTLRRGATLSGEVYDADGELAKGCLVIIQMPTLQERRIINADSRGSFLETGLTPGVYQVQAFPGIEGLQDENGETLGQSELLAALKMTTVELVDEGKEHVVLGELPANPVLVRGRVTLSSEPVPGAMISFIPTDGGGMDRLKIRTLDDDGRYEVRLDEPGDYLVTIQAVDSPGRQNSVEQRRNVPEAEECRLDFELPLGRVSGRVRDASGEPLAGTRVTLSMQEGMVFGTVFGGQYNEIATDENGEYEIPYLRPGNYVVAAGGVPLGGFLGEGTSPGRQAVGVEVEEGEWVRGVDFRLETPGKITGTVRDASGALVSGANIFVRDESGRLVELFSISQTNASGKFEYPGLAPGEYSVTARTASQASSGGVSVRVRSGEPTDITVTVQDGTILVVNLVDRSGADVPARVSVLDSEGREMNGMLSLAEIMARYNGGAGSSVQRVGPLPPGTYEVRAFAEDGRDAKRKLTLEGRPERKAKLWLK